MRYPTLQLLRRALCGWLLLAGAGPALGSPQEAPQPVEASAPAAEEGWAARAGDTRVSWPELDRLLLNRHALSERGREALVHLLKSKVLEHLMHESGLVIRDEEVDAKIAQLDRELEKAGQANGIEAMLEAQKMSMEMFREFMRLAIAQEVLARRALGMPEDADPSGEQQEMWLDSEISKRELVELPPPWADGLVCRCGDVEVRLGEFLRHLRTQIDGETLREACFQMLLEKRIRARMPDLSAKALATAVDDEITRRKNAVRADPRYKGIPYEELLKARGIIYSAWPQDPSVRVAALSHIWMDRRYKEEDLRRVYETEREYFDNNFGEGVEAWVLFLNAVKYENELINRSFEQAEEELEGLKPLVKSREHFQEILGAHSEDAKSREREGYVGYVTRGGKQLPALLRTRIFAALDSDEFDPALPVDSPKRLLGPLRMPQGVVLLWLGERRPMPAWDSMMYDVHAELRRRFIAESLNMSSMTTWLDT